MGDFHVIFTEYNAIIKKGLPDKIEDFIRVNPDLSKVQGLSPSFWKIDNDEIAPMTNEEMIKRIEDTDSYLVKNNLIYKYVDKPFNVYKTHKIYLLVSYILGGLTLWTINNNLVKKILLNLNLWN